MTASYIAAIRDTPDEHRSLNDQIILALVAEMDGLVEQLEALQEQYRVLDLSFHHAEEFIEHMDMSYRWAEWCEGRNPACVCGEINTRHCPVHAGGSSPAKKRPCRPESQSTHCRYCGAAPMYQRDDCPAMEPKT